MRGRGEQHSPLSNMPRGIGYIDKDHYFAAAAWERHRFGGDARSAVGQGPCSLRSKLETHAAGGRDGGSMAQKGIFNERLLHVISVATQVAISLRVRRYKHYENVNKRKEEEQHQHPTHRYRGVGDDEVSMHSRMSSITGYRCTSSQQVR